MLAGKTVLLVEDEVMVALLAEMMLRDMGAAEVILAHTLTEGQSALERMPDLAVLDINLRGEESFPIAEALAARGTPYVYATAYGNAAAEDGPSAPIVTKPYDEAALRAALGEVL